MNEQLLQLTIDNAVDNAVDRCGELNFDFIQGFVWGVVDHALAGVHNDLCVGAYEGTVFVAIKWEASNEFIAYYSAINPKMEDYNENG